MGGETDTDVKFPKRLRYRGKGKVLATIYKRPGQPQPYRLYWRCRVDGKPRSRFSDFPTYSAAKAKGETVVGELAKGAQAARLSPGQATDALAALERLQRYYEATGRRVSLLGAVSEFAEVSAKLPRGRTLHEGIDGFLANVVDVKRMDLGEAMKEFIETRRLKTVPSKEGRRPRISADHHYNTSLWLKEFADTFPGHAVCDLKKEHVALYMKQHGKLGAKTRNERRALVKMFLAWAVERDYLSKAHRLYEASELAMEPGDDDGEIECYTAGDLRAILERASQAPAAPKNGDEPAEDYRHLLPVIALAGLAGLRLKEAMRLSFEDIFKRPDHIEVGKTKSKTRSRRLIPVCPALAAWLEPYRQKTGAIWGKSYDMFHIDFAALRGAVEVEPKHNGLRHSFISAHFAAYNDEGLTAAQAGNSPDMIHHHYKGLLTKAEGEAWFAVTPKRPANVIQLSNKNAI